MQTTTNSIDIVISPLATVWLQQFFFNM